MSTTSERIVGGVAGGFGGMLGHNFNWGNTYGKAGTVANETGKSSSANAAVPKSLCWCGGRMIWK